MSNTVFITGASSGIGKATAKLFAQKGWDVVATMRKPEDGAELAGGSTLVTRLDVLDPESIESAVAEAVSRFGGIDVLVNNAGYGAYGPLEGTPMETLRRQFDVNVFGLVEVTRKVMANMRQRKTGTIINVSSIGGRIVFPFGTLYHGSKWAVEGISEALSFEVKVFGGRVKIVEPGGVNTDFSGRSFVFSNDESLSEYQPLVQAFTQAVQNMDTSANQEPEGVAEVIWKAANDESDQLRYISGAGAEATLKNRYSYEGEEAFIAAMKQSYGLS